MGSFVVWFKDLRMGDVKSVGGKNASLGEMYNTLTKKGVRVPNGFAINTKAYWHFLRSAGIDGRILEIMAGIGRDKSRISRNAGKIRGLITGAKMPADMEAEIMEAYKLLCREYGPNTDVAVRSSATAEDMPNASFAGEQETYLDIRGRELIRATKKCMASLFTERSISYRMDEHIDGSKVALSVGVQKMIRSDIGASGVMFTVDTETGFRDAIIINAAYGLGEFVVQGTVNPDEYVVFKPTLGRFAPIVSKRVGSKAEKLIYGKGRSPTRKVPVPEADRRKFVLADHEILELARYGKAIEDHYSEKAGSWKPMDIEWAKDGRTRKIYIVQARPETVQVHKKTNIIDVYELKGRGRILTQGDSVGNRIGAGVAHVLMDPKKAGAFRDGDVIVTGMTNPDWEPLMKRAAAIVTERGGRVCHAAIVSRELGVPCVIGTGNATAVAKTGMPVTVDCSQGEKGFVYDGALRFGHRTVDVRHLPETRTKIMMNVGFPEQAYEQSFIPNSGVGLARLEFIITSDIRVHPLALINYNTLGPKLRREIDDVTPGYRDKKQFFIDKMAEGVATIAAAFYPKDVILRFSDFKTNEYAGLIGGRSYEPKEDNPMIGWRGASRYYTEGYRSGFALECRAVKKVREVMGLKNLKVMIPFCRTVGEGRSVLAEMAKNGLRRGVDGLQVYVMCEIPSNVILADQFSQIFDGFSIGSNDLTQLTLGLDRDSELVAPIYNERNDAVKRLISQAIKVAKANKRKIGICGQAPSDFPDFAQFLVREGIDSISLNPDTVIKTTLKIAEQERKMKK